MPRKDGKAYRNTCEYSLNVIGPIIVYCYQNVLYLLRELMVEVVFPAHCLIIAHMDLRRAVYGPGPGLPKC